MIITKLNKYLNRLIKQPVITDDDIIEVRLLYTSFKGLDDDYNTMTPVDRKRVIRELLDALTSDIKSSSSKHINIVLHFVNNLGEIPLMESYHSNMETLRHYTQRMLSDKVAVYEEDDYKRMPATLRKYAGQDYRLILKDITAITKLMTSLSVIAQPVLSGTDTNNTFDKYMKKVKRIAIPHKLDKNIVGASDYLLYVGRFFLIYVDELGVPILRSLIFPEKSTLEFPIAKLSDVEDVETMACMCYNNIKHHFTHRDHMVSLANSAMVNLKADPSQIEIDTLDNGRILLQVITTADNINNLASITLTELIDFLAKSIRYRVKQHEG